MQLELDWIAASRERLNGRSETTTGIAETQHTQSEEYFRKQDTNLATLRTVTETLGRAVEEQYDLTEELYKQEHATEAEVLDAKRTFFDNQVKLADIELRVHELELRRIEAERFYLGQLERVADFRAELEKLDIEASKIRQSDLETDFASELRIQEIERNIARYKEQLSVKGRIVTKHAGRILEITGAVGQVVGEGQRLGAIEIQRPDSKLVAVVYFDVGDGKKIEKGDATRISPTTVQRERYGSMIGQVTSVSSFPVTTDAVTNVVGNAEVAQILTAGGNKIEVFSDIEPDLTSPTGYRWTSLKGFEGDITAGTTVIVRTTVETRRPISYIIPLLRRWSGG
jgi:HlyD family secretion protein